jgi:chromosome segregation ATPase
MNGLPILLTLGAILAAVAFFMQSRTARARAASLASRIDAAQAEAAAAQLSLAAQKGELKEKREETISLRQKLEELRKKSFEQAEAQKRLGGAVALREEVDRIAARLAEARAEAEHQVEVSRAAESARARAVQEAERFKAALDRKLAEPAPVVPARPAPVAAPEGSVQAELEKKVAELESKLVAEADRADKSEARSTELKKKLADVEKELKASRGKVETDRRVFIVQKGELDLAHDRYAELKRRNDQLRREHEELIEAVRQAAREERQQAEGKSTEASMVAEGAPDPAPVASTEPTEPTPAG